jgi:hypothetical protein
MTEPRPAYPVLIVEDDRIRSGEIDTLAASTRGKQEQPRCIPCIPTVLEAFHLLTPRRRIRLAIDATQRPIFVFGRPILDDVKPYLELGEDEHFVPSLEKRIQKPLEDHHLPARLDELLVNDLLVGVRIHRPIKQEGMRADFTQLHNGVLQVHVVNLLDCHTI